MESISKLEIVLLITFSIGVIVTEAKPPVFTAKQKADIDRLRQAVARKLTMEYMKSDAYLIKWLKAKKFDHGKAREALEKTLEWRKQVNADNLPNHKFDPETERKYVVDYDTSKDKYGSPVTLLPFGDWNLRRKLLEGKLISELNPRLDYMEEKSAQLCYNHSGDSTGFLIAEIQAFGLKTHLCTGCIPFYISWVIHHETHYPFNYRRILVINAPRIFDTVVNVMQPLMTESTKESFLVQGYDRNDHQAEISKYANLADIPVRFGGTKKQKT